MASVAPHIWLQSQPLQPGEQLFAILCNASAAEPFKAFRSCSDSLPSPIWADTAYAEWEPVMPYVVAVEPGSAFLDWVAQTPAGDWGWLAVSRAPLAAMVDQLRGLTQVLLPNGQATFFRFWDGRFLLPILQSEQVDAAQLLPLVDRCLINGRSVHIGGRALASAQAFPWWTVPPALLNGFAGADSAARLSNLLKWLSEERPDVYELFSESVLRCKLKHFLHDLSLPDAPKHQCVDYLLAERR